MVLLHGLGCSWRVWTPVLPSLAATRDVLAFDLPGFGRSAPLAAPLRPTAAALADAVERELEAAGLPTADLVGNSVGGWIALELARRGRARSVVAISPAGLGSIGERASAMSLACSAYTTAKLLAPYAAALTSVAATPLLLALVHSRPWRVQPEDARQTLLALAGSPGFLETLEWTLGSGQAEGLDEIGCPVLIAWGTEDRVLAPGQAARFSDLIPRAELRPLPGLGHVPMPDDPELVARTILDFTSRARRDEAFAAASTSADATSDLPLGRPPARMEAVRGAGV
jgi:pimeloyl-ACP methyl ester carboxylesterase